MRYGYPSGMVRDLKKMLATLAELPNGVDLKSLRAIFKNQGRENSRTEKTVFRANFGLKSFLTDEFHMESFKAHEILLFFFLV